MEPRDDDAERFDISQKQGMLKVASHHTSIDPNLSLHSPSRQRRNVLKIKMIPRQQRWLVGTLLLCLSLDSFAFQTPKTRFHITRTTERRAMVDPNDVASVISSSHIATHSEFHTILSTMLSSSLQPATGHANPLFGPPDPYLAAGKSIAPSAKALVDMGITQAKTTSEIVPNASPAFQESVTTAMNKGWKILDSANIMNGGGSALPGFSATHGILPTHNINVPTETPESFALEVAWAAKYFDVMDKLPFAAFWYCMVEFFILRPGIDFYKEDIEADPTGVVSETVAVTGVRVLVIAIISFLTVIFFG